MGDVARNGGFETDAAWVLTGNASYGTLFVNNGARAMFVSADTADSTTGTIYQTLNFKAGDTYVIKFAALYFSGDTNLEVYMDIGDGVEALFASRTGPDKPPRVWQSWQAGAFTALGTSGSIKIRAGLKVAPVTSVWWIDDVTVQGASLVAIKLAERSVDGVISRLQSQLGTELGLIDTDRGDGVTLTVPPNAAYYNHPRSEIPGTYDVVIEVFEGPWEFPNKFDVNDERATYDIPITIRVTCFGRNGETAEVMTDRMRRYACGVYNVFIKDHTLGGSDAAIVAATIDAVSPYWDTEGEDEDQVIKNQVTLAATVKCEETQA